MEKADSISLVIPAHNSEKVIGNSIKEYLKFISKYKKYELIIVCNACTDNTAEKAKRAAGKNNHVSIIEINERGKGFAVLRGFAVAKYSIIGFMDADNCFNLNSVRKIILMLEENDCVIASKWLGRDFLQIAEPFMRKMLAIGWRMLSFIMLGMNFKDTQAGCKFLKRKAFLPLNRNFVCTGFDFDIELLYKLKGKGCKVKEIYVPTTKAFKFSTFRLRFVPGMAWHLFKLWAHNL